MRRGISYSKSGFTKLATILIIVILCMGVNGITFFAPRATFVVNALPATADISLTITPDATKVVSGTLVHYLYNVSNTGDTALTGAIYDYTFGVVGNYVNLPPGSWVGFNVGHVITADTSNDRYRFGHGPVWHKCNFICICFRPNLHPTADISLTITPDETKVVSGTLVHYLYNVSNTGDTALTGAIYDYTFGVVGNYVNLPPGSWVGFNVGHVITADTSNDATAWGMDQFGTNVTSSASAFVQTYIPTADISLTITPDATKVVSGTLVHYLYNVSNTGDTALTGAIYDYTFGVVGNYVNVPPGSWVGFNVGHVITADTSNDATAWGMDQFGTNVTSSASAFVQTYIPTADISLTITPDATKVVSGTLVHYLYNVSNTGDTALTGAIYDYTFGVVGNYVNVPPGSWVGFNVGHVITADTSNDATAWGMDQFGTNVTSSASAFVQTYIPTADISLTITPDATKVVSGTLVHYLYNVSNTGDTALTGAIYDYTFGVVGAFTNLQPGDSVCFTETCVLKSNAYNVAIVTATDPFGQEVRGTASCFVRVCWPSPSPVITVTSPNGGESWVQGSCQTIKWSSDGSVGSYVKIELLKDGVVNRVLVSSTPNDGSWVWTISSKQTAGTDYTIRITSTSKSAIADSSNDNFAIKSEKTGKLPVTPPNCGESWRHGTTHAITWSKSGSTGPYVKIELLKDGVVNRIITSRTLNDCYYRWYIPSSLTPGNDYKIRITSIANPWIKESSNNNFIIVT